MSNIFRMFATQYKKYIIMATVYKLEIVSDWVNYPEKDLKKLIQEKLDFNKDSLRVTKLVKQ